MTNNEGFFCLLYVSHHTNFRMYNRLLLSFSLLMKLLIAMHWAWAKYVVVVLSSSQVTEEAGCVPNNNRVTYHPESVIYCRLRNIMSTGRDSP